MVNIEEKRSLQSEKLKFSRENARWSPACAVPDFNVQDQAAARAIIHLDRKPFERFDFRHDVLAAHARRIVHANRLDERLDICRDALERFYLYQIATRRTAFAKPFVWWVKDKLDAGAMKAAAKPTNTAP